MVGGEGIEPPSPEGSGLQPPVIANSTTQNWSELRESNPSLLVGSQMPSPDRRLARSNSDDNWRALTPAFYVREQGPGEDFHLCIVLLPGPQLWCLTNLVSLKCILIVKEQFPATVSTEREWVWILSPETPETGRIRCVTRWRYSRRDVATTVYDRRA